MAEKKNYWLRLKRDFFKRHDIRIIEAMPNGKDYVLFYLKLLCESIDHDGSLRFSDTIPYSEEMLAALTDTNVDVVRSAVNIFAELNMMELLDDGTLFMSELHKMVGSTKAEDNAERQRRHREKLKSESVTPALLPRYESVTDALSVTENRNESIEIRDKSIDSSSGVQGEAFALPLNDNTMFSVSKEDVAKWRELYPAVDVEQQLRNMVGWLDSHPDRRKTRRGINAFITSWLSKEQDRAPARPKNGPTYKKDPNMAKYVQRLKQQREAKNG